MQRDRLICGVPTDTKSNNYSQLVSMHWNRIHKRQVHMAHMGASMEVFRVSYSRITLIPPSHISGLLEDTLHDDDPVETQVQEYACDVGNVDKHNVKHDSDFPEMEEICDWDDIMSKMTDINQQEMLAKNWRLLKLIYQQQA